MQFNSRNITIAITLFIAGILIWYFREIVSYVLIAWVVSMLGQPLMGFFKRRLQFRGHWAGDALCAALTLLTFMVTFGLIVSVFVPLIVEQANNLSQVNYVDVGKSLEAPIAHLSAYCQKFGVLQPGQSALEVIQKNVYQYIDPSQVSNIFRSVVSTAGGFAVGLVSVLFISFFFLKENGMLTNFLSSLFPQEREGNLREAVSDTSTLLSRYFSGIFLQILFVATFLSIALMVLGIKNALLIAMFAAIINVIPYLGPSLGAIFACFITISSNLNLDFYTQTVPLLIRVGIVFASLQFLNDWFVGPIIFSNRVKAHPLEIFLVTLAGAKIGGIGGMLLAIPGYTVLRVIARAFFNNIRFVQKMTGSLQEESQENPN